MQTIRHTGATRINSLAHHVIYETLVGFNWPRTIQDAKGFCAAGKLQEALAGWHEGF
jgi:hypothetical protein